MNVASTDDRFLNTLYRGVTNRDEFGQAVRLLQELFECKGAVLVTVDARDARASFVSTSGVLQDNLQLYVEKYAQIDPGPARYLRLAVGTALSTDRMFTPEENAASRFFNEYFKPIGLVETLGGPLYMEGGSFSMVALMRGSERRQFDDSDIARLEQLMPHLARALQLRREFFRVDARSLGLQAMAERQHSGLVLLGHDGSVLFINSAMKAIAQRSDGFAIERNGRPMPVNIEARRRFDTLLAAVTGGDTGGMLTVPRESGRDYVVLITPSHPASTLSEWEKSRGPLGAIIVVHDPDQKAADTVGILAEGLKLPKGAARLVASLAAAHDLKSFAKAEGITIHTARFHLRTALVRTGTKSQAELVRLAVQLLRDFALMARDTIVPE